MLLNFARPQLAPNIVSAPKSNVDVDSVLGLAPSQYDGLKSVGDTGYFYGDGRMYQPYTVQPRSFIKDMGPFGTQVWSPSHPGMYGMSSGPSYSPIFGYSGGWSATGGPEAGTIYKGDQAFRPVSEDVTGFTKSKGENDIYDYAPSMAYVYANTPRPAPTPTPNVTSFLSSPTMPSYSGNYGAGRFLNTGNLLGFNFGTPSGQTAGGETTA